MLNVHSIFDLEQVDSVRQRPVKEEMAEPPTEEDLVGALTKLKNEKASGESGILPKMVNASCVMRDL